MTRPYPFASGLLLVAFTVLSCVTTGPARRGPGGACQSVRDCHYGLVCESSADSDRRTCRYETWGTCDDADDCLAGQTCRDGACTIQCVSHKDCEDGVCQIGECVAAGENECVMASDCGPGRDCVAGRCEQRLTLRCFTDLDCRPTESCFGGWCR